MLKYKQVIWDHIMMSSSFIYYWVWQTTIGPDYRVFRSTGKGKPDDDIIVSQKKTKKKLEDDLSKRLWPTKK